MSNFAFLRDTLPDLRADCVRAESYLSSDPRAACVYARRVIEHLVNRIYAVDRLPVPYRDDLAAKLGEPAFQRKVGAGIAAKFDLIRRLGNKAVHGDQPVAPRSALDALRELYHVVIWTAFRYSAAPSAVPMGRQFDPQLAGRQSPLSREDVRKLAARFKEQDEAHARQLRARDDMAARLEAENAELREEVRAAQAAKDAAVVDTHDYSEAETRTAIIDGLLHEAGWPLVDTRDREYPVTGMPNVHGTGYVDYVLWGADGLPLAVVEAKKSTVDPAIGQQQAKLYADSLQQMTGRRPVIFYTNGYRSWLWDDGAAYPPRLVQGFFTRDQLELMIARRTTRLPLADATIDKGIVERAYQDHAIRAVDEAFAAKQRAALLVMATGSGKTRTVIALVDQLMRSGWVKRVLFLADRTALVTQAVNAFKAHLSNATTVNLVAEKNADGRVFVSTYPTMLNLINDVAEGEEGRRFGPGYFDLVIVDEAHRSVYQKYRAIFAWFDALLVGLTATPKDEVDRNTYSLFALEDGVPTDVYELSQAVDEGFLVPPHGVSMPTRFTRQGVTYDQLSEKEKDDWDALEWGDDDPPDGVSAEDLNRFLFNADTVDKVLATLMAEGLKVAGGDWIGKTIVFAKNQRHAQFIQERFDAQYPQYAGEVARTITHATTYAQGLIDDFGTADKAPQIAISVDMLDTGIDVPEVVNLLFFKTVRSKSKFWQMLGRGTRLRPDLFGPGLDKSTFLVFDVCGNLEYFGQDLPGTEGSVQKSLGQRLVETRLGLVAALDGQVGDGSPADPDPGHGEESERGLRVDLAWSLHEFVTGMNVHNVLVRPEREWVDTYVEWKAWHRLTPVQAGDIADHLAGLPSALGADDEQAKRFDLLLLRLQLAQLEADTLTFERLRQQVQEVAAQLLGRPNIPSVKAQLELLDELAGDEWWVDVTLPMLEIARRRVRSLVQFLDRGGREPLYTDFEDELGEMTVINLPGVQPGTNWERFRAKAAAYLRAHEDHLALQRLRRNQQLTEQDLESLEQILMESGAGTEADLARAREESHGLGLFVRSLVGLDPEAVREAFAAHLTDATFTTQQQHFIKLIVEHLTANGSMEPGRLYESPFNEMAPTGPEELFGDQRVDDIVAILRRVRATAQPVVNVA